MQTRQYFSKKKKQTWIKLTGFSDAAPRLYCPCRIVICLHTEHRGVLKSSFKRVRAFQIELEFGSVGFWREVKTGVPGKKPHGAKERTKNKLNPHMASTTGLERGLHWWDATSLTTVPPLVPNQDWRITEQKYIRTQIGSFKYKL